VIVRPPTRIRIETPARDRGSATAWASVHSQRLQRNRGEAREGVVPAEE
jgi:hypothetical protein